MATLIALTLARTGINPVPSVAADAAGDEVANPVGDAAFIVRNGGASSINVTLDVQASGPDGTTVTDPTVAVPAGETRMIGPFPPSIYNDPDTGRARIAYSAVTSVTVLAVRVAFP